jgi:hypothetical protein
MRYTKLLLVISLIFITILLVSPGCRAQSSTPHSNSWIDYSKPYVRIGVIKKGIHSVPISLLPKTFPINSPDKIQLWRRGKEVSIISISDKEILFYGVPNDGACDSLLYRPMSSRINPYFSMYSDESAYFLTIGNAAGRRAQIIKEAVNDKIPLTSFHRQLLVKQFVESYSLSLEKAVRASVHSSYFEGGASKSGPMIKADSLIFRDFKLDNFVEKAPNPMLKLLVHGRSENERKIEVYVGKNKTSLRLVTTLANAGFNPSEYSIKLNPDDIDGEKSGILALKSVDQKKDYFSLTYFSVDFPQTFQLEKQLGKEFRLAPSTEAVNRIAIQGATADFKVIDVTEADNPVVLNGPAENLMVLRKGSGIQTLFTSNDIIKIEAGKIKELTFKTLSPKETNYIIITTNNLLDGASKFADYRSSPAGGSFKSLVANIEDIYNEFNYGEPSPIAIKQFMSYMLTEGGKDKYLFLIGKSITRNEWMRRELPDEVPTIGYPGSDALLVENIAGAGVNVPAIPVGRLGAITNENVLHYLQKIKDYDSNRAEDTGWSKNVLHLNGGKTTSEIVLLRNSLEALVPMVSGSQMGGHVKAYVKQQGMAEIENVNITADINKGVGLLTYMGHGAPYVTDLDFGYITDAPRGYNNLYKYPMMYFAGCGVGNLFSARINLKPSNPKASDRIPLTLDWLIAPDMGSVAIIANSFESLVTPSSQYLAKLYYYMFKDPVTAHLSIGRIQLAVAKDIIANERSHDAISTVHQSLLQGDPALKLILVSKPKPDNPDQVNDHVPPILTVHFNDRPLKANEIIGLNPEISISLDDDQKLLPDTSLIDIFIKRCSDDNCDFEKINYTKSGITLDSAANGALHLNYKTLLGTGIYEILINARDHAGNAITQPYRIGFEIAAEETMPNELIVSPNPAFSYLRFELRSPRHFDLKSVRYLIYNQRGIVIEDKLVTFPIWSLTSEWYWQPSQPIPGLYSYRVFLIDNNNADFDTFTGKVILNP